MTPAWRDRGLLGDLSLDDLAGDPPAARAVRALTRAAAADDTAASRAALGWPADAERAGWILRGDGCRLALMAPDARLRRAEVDLRVALARGGVDLALAFALLGHDDRARRRVLAARRPLEARLATAARAATGAAAAALVARGRAPDDALAQARTLVARLLARALEPSAPPPGGPATAARAAKAALGEDAADLAPLVGAAGLGRVLQGLLGLTLDAGGRLLRSRRGARRAQGSWFTPAPLAAAVADLALGPALGLALARAGAGEAAVEALAGLRVVDPACGSGRFLAAALDALVRAALAAGAEPALAPLRRRLVGAVAGVDLDPAAAALARAALARHARARTADVTVREGDALDGAALALGPADAVLGNPPWHRERDGRDLLRRARASAAGAHARARTDLWMLFAHLALDQLRPGGAHAFVAPAYWLRGAGPGPRHLRARLDADARWRALVDLGRLDRFEGGGAGARAIVYVVDRADPVDVGQADGRQVDVWTVAPDAAPDALGRALRAGAAAGVAHRRVAPDEARGPRGEVLLDRAPGADARRLLDRLQGGALPAGWLLSEGLTANPERLGRAQAARVPGARPGEPVFVLPAAAARALPARERRLLLPWLAHDAIGRLRVAPPADAPRLIHATPATLPDLRAAPALARHLARFRPVLEARRETRLGRRAWFHLHWPRDPRVVRGPRVLVPRWTRWPGGALVEDDCAVGESVWVLVPPDPADAAAAAALLASLPFALGVLLVSKRRGRGVDMARAALAACPWPDTAAFVAARRGGGPLAGCRAAHAALARDPAARRAEGPWWRHPLARVRDAGEALDRAACGLVGVDYERARAAADEALAGPPAPAPAPPPPTPVDPDAELVVSLEPAWCAAGLGAECLHLDAAAARAGDLVRLLDPFTTPLDGAASGPADGRALLRLDPSVDAPTLAAVLRRAGWAVAPGAEEARVWSASRGPAGKPLRGLPAGPLARPIHERPTAM